MYSVSHDLCPTRIHMPSPVPSSRICLCENWINLAHLRLFNGVHEYIQLYSYHIMIYIYIYNEPKESPKRTCFFRNKPSPAVASADPHGFAVTPVATEQQSQTGEITKIRLTSDFDEKGIVLLPVSWLITSERESYNIIQHHNHHMNKYVIYNIL